MIVDKKIFQNVQMFNRHIIKSWVNLSSAEGLSLLPQKVLHSYLFIRIKTKPIHSSQKVAPLCWQMLITITASQNIHFIYNYSYFLQNSNNFDHDYGNSIMIKIITILLTEQDYNSTTLLELQFESWTLLGWICGEHGWSVTCYIGRVNLYNVYQIKWKVFFYHRVEPIKCQCLFLKYYHMANAFMGSLLENI